MAKTKKMFKKPTQDKMINAGKNIVALITGIGLSNGMSYLISKLDKNGKIDDIVGKLGISVTGGLLSASATNPFIQTMGIGMAGTQAFSAFAQTVSPYVPKDNGMVAESLNAVLGNSTPIIIDDSVKNKRLGLGNPFLNTQVNWNTEIINSNELDYNKIFD